ncbi:MAG: putative DNA-binding domain-containing protein, partial [Chlamydiia bacterium]|nr:putative DNA-binding domain-containing protein [Chlamydiia bacterium]
MWTITLYDAKVPHSLCHLQKWFAKAIVEPLDRESCLKNHVAHDADQYVFPSTTLNPRQRIELYSQQYWWRLLGALHKSFPLTVRLLGYTMFNQQIAQPYLVKFPSTHWSLSFLGCQLPKWIREEYQGDQKELLEQAVAVD